MTRLAPLILLLTLATVPVAAEETIVDPENPAFSDEGSEDEETKDTASDDKGGEETIFDPENPSFDERDEGPSPTDTASVDDDLDDLDDTSGFDSVRFEGDWATRLRLDTAWQSQEEDVFELESHLGLRLAWDASQQMRVVVGGELRHWMAGKANPDETDVVFNAAEPRADLDLRLLEAYVLWREGAWSVALGNLVTRWGSTDLTRPGDVVNPVDLTSLDGASAGKRLPQPTLDLSYSGDRWGWQGLLVPIYVPNDVWLVGRDSALLNANNTLVNDQFPVARLTDTLLSDAVIDDAQPLLNSTNPPDELPTNASLGTRFTATAANTDLGLGYFFGWDRQAYFEIAPEARTLLVTVAEDDSFLDDLDALSFFGRNPDALAAANALGDRAAAGEPIFESDVRRLHTIVADGARYLGPIGVRADVAFQPEKTYFTESFQSVRRPTLSTALGLSWERLRSESDLFTVTVEGFFVRPFGAEEGITKTFVEEDERGSPDDSLLLFGDYSAGVAAAVVWMVPGIDARLQLGGRSDLTQPDFIGSAELARDVGDSLEIAVGGILFEGPPPSENFSAGGLYDPDDAVFVRVSGLL